MTYQTEGPVLSNMKKHSGKLNITAVAALLAALVLLLSACGAPSNNGSPSGNAQNNSAPEDLTPQGHGDTDGKDDQDDMCSQILAKMTLREKVGQMFIIRPDQLDLSIAPAGTHTSKNSKAKTLSPAMIKVLEDYPAGGFIFFDKNIESKAQIMKFTAQVREVSKYLPFVAIDEEGGKVTRLAGSTDKGIRVKTYKSMGAIGKTGDPANALEAGQTIGKYLEEYGFNLDFAPVSDINTNPRNVIIGDRAFGSDPELVAKMVCAFIDGLHESKVLSSVKHFPGHGDTTADTHYGMVAVKKTWEQLKEAELIPFEASFGTTDFVMIAHINLPNATSDGRPASLSKELITDKLRGELGFSGLVTTDSLAMEAITDQYSQEESAVLAVEAGVDVLLMPLDYVKSFDAVVAAVESGRIPESRIDESVLRILRAKETVR
ncbi:MAG: glycoside hydrolase family 3 protein [Clostridia bacterium]|nr:glycoside hydrolase family 3 protein [Clostridia bacterium]